MSVQYDTLLQQVLALPSKERAALVKSVIDSLHEDDPDEVRAAWIEEIDLRTAAIGRGEAKFYPVDQVLDRLAKEVRVVNETVVQLWKGERDVR